MKKVSCLNCGNTFTLTNVFEDSLGVFTVCPECGGSFDVDVTEEEKIKLQNGTEPEI